MGGENERQLPIHGALSMGIINTKMNIKKSANMQRPIKVNVGPKDTLSLSQIGGNVGPLSWQ